MAERYKQLKELVHTKDLFQRITISDYLFSKCLLFAKVNLPDEEFHLYQKLFEIIYQQLVQPDLLIYLHAPVQQLQKNIRKRNRSYEQSIPDDYLFKIQETYTNYIKQHNIKTLFIDAAMLIFLATKNISRLYWMHWKKIMSRVIIILRCPDAAFLDFVLQNHSD